MVANLLWSGSTLLLRFGLSLLPVITETRDPFPEVLRGALMPGVLGL